MYDLRGTVNVENINNKKKNCNLILILDINIEKPLSAIIIKIEGKNNRVLFSGKESLIKRTKPIPKIIDGNNKKSKFYFAF